VAYRVRPRRDHHPDHRSGARSLDETHNLLATNGQVIATSESYESKAGALNGIDSVKRNAPDAEIDDQTDS
jgi:uncharacterized protein YegP (UPF0339 family)